MFLLCLLALSMAIPAASGHVGLADSEPRHGENLDELPEELLLSYAESGLQAADVTVTGPNGEAVSGDAELDDTDSGLVFVPLEDAGDGLYVVEWEVVGTDGHTTQNTFFFTVGDGPVDSEAVLNTYENHNSDGLSWFEAGANGLVLLGLIGTIGIAITTLGVVYPALDRDRRTFEQVGVPFERNVRRVFAGSALLLLTGLLAVGLVHSSRLGSLSVETVVQFLETPLGEMWLVQFGLATVIFGSAVLAVRGFVGQLSWLSVAIGAGPLVALALAWTSHSATAVDRFVGTGVDFIHLLGVSLWVGGLVTLVLFVSSVTEGEDAADRHSLSFPDRLSLLTETLRRHSLVALTGVALTLSTGLVLADWHVQSTTGLIETEYGLILVSKLILLGIALTLAGYIRFVLRRRLSPTRSGVFGQLIGRTDTRTDGGTPTTIAVLERTLTLELVVLVLVVVLAGLLTAGATAAVAVDTGHGEVESETLTAELEDDIEIELTVLPTHGTVAGQFTVDETDPIVFEVRFERNGQQLHSDGAVTANATTSDGEDGFELELVESNGTYSAMQTFPEYGDWTIEITGTFDERSHSARFEAYVMADTDERVLSHLEHGVAGEEISLPDDDGHDHDGHGHSDDTHEHGTTADHDHADHDHGSPIDSPLQLAGLLVLLYGGLAVAYEANAIRREP